MTELAELRRIVEGAEGPWPIREVNRWFTVSETGYAQDPKAYNEAAERTPKITRYFATFDPLLVGKLLDLWESLEGKNLTGSLWVDTQVALDALREVGSNITSLTSSPLGTTRSCTLLSHQERGTMGDALRSCGASTARRKKP